MTGDFFFWYLLHISSSTFVDDGLVSPTIKYSWRFKRSFLISLDIAKASQRQESIGRSTSLINQIIALYRDNIMHVKISQRLYQENIFSPIRGQEFKQKCLIRLNKFSFSFIIDTGVSQINFCNNHKLSVFAMCSFAYNYYCDYLQNRDSTHCLALMLWLLHSFLSWLHSN